MPIQSKSLSIFLCRIATYPRPPCSRCTSKRSIACAYFVLRPFRPTGTCHIAKPGDEITAPPDNVYSECIILLLFLVRLAPRVLPGAGHKDRGGCGVFLPLLRRSVLLILPLFKTSGGLKDDGHDLRGA